MSPHAYWYSSFVFALLNTSPAEQTVYLDFVDVFFDQVREFRLREGIQPCSMLRSTGQGIPDASIRRLRFVAEGCRRELGQEHRHHPGRIQRHNRFAPDKSMACHTCAKRKRQARIWRVVVRLCSSVHTAKIHGVWYVHAAGYRGSAMGDMTMITVDVQHPMMGIKRCLPKGTALEARTASMNKGWRNRASARNHKT